MSNSQSLAQPTAYLLQRAAETSLNSARIIAHSVELITRSCLIVQAVSGARARRRGEGPEVLRTGLRPAARNAQAATASNNDWILLPLTPPRLLELAEEFHCLAMTAATPESRAAFEDLAFRYTALAAGYDNAHVGSRMMH